MLEDVMVEGGTDAKAAMSFEPFSSSFLPSFNRFLSPSTLSRRFSHHVFFQRISSCPR